MERTLLNNQAQASHSLFPCISSTDPEHISHIITPSVRSNRVERSIAYIENLQPSVGRVYKYLNYKSSTSRFFAKSMLMKGPSVLTQKTHMSRLNSRTWITGLTDVATMLTNFPAENCDQKK